MPDSTASAPAAPAHAKSYKRPNKTLLLNRETCISCAGCVGTCPELALDMFGLDLQVFQDKCTYCTLCVRFCPVGALSIAKHAPAGGENAMATPKAPEDFGWPTGLSAPATHAALYGDGTGHGHFKSHVSGTGGAL
jgi:NAD-dependent dihydropyrimidine dehydrogenase PreA subunit